MITITRTLKDLSKFKVEKLYIDLSIKKFYTNNLNRLKEASHIPHIELNLSNNKLEANKVLDILIQYPNIKALNLIKCSLSELPKSIGEMSNLEQLFLKGNQLTSLPDSIGELKKMKWLKLNTNKIKTIPSVIFELENLEKLELESTGIKVIPLGITKLKKLRELELAMNPLKELPLFLSELKNLKNLGVKKIKNLDYNRFFDIITQIPDYKKLYFNHYELTELPKEVIKAQQLEEINIANNNFKAFPEILIELPNLQVLYFYNRILKMNEDNFKLLSKLKKLKEFNFSIFMDADSEEKKVIPETFCELTNLEQLYAFNAKSISALPQNIGNLKKLKRITLKRTSISKLPDSFFELTNLEELRIDRECFAEGQIEKITAFTKLRFLDLNKYKQKDFESFAQLNNLEELKNTSFWDVLPTNAFFKIPLKKLRVSLQEELILSRITEFKNLEELEISTNEITFDAIAEKASQLKNLKELRISFQEKTMTNKLMLLKNVKKIIADYSFFQGQNTIHKFPLNFVLFPEGIIEYIGGFSDLNDRAFDAKDKVNNMDLQDDNKKILYYGILNHRQAELNEFIPNPLLKGINNKTVFIAGRPNGVTKKEQETNLKNKGAKIHKSLQDDTDYIVLNPFTKKDKPENYIKNEYQYILPDHLHQALIEENTPFLMEEGNEELSEQITELIKGKGNEELVLQLIEGGGATKIILSYLLVIYLLYPDKKIRADAGKLFKKYASDNLRTHIKNHWKIKMREEGVWSLYPLMQHTELDLFSFLLAYASLGNSYIATPKIHANELTETIKNIEKFHSLELILKSPEDAELLLKYIENIKIETLRLYTNFKKFPKEIFQLMGLKNIIIHSSVPEIEFPKTKMNNCPVEELTIHYASLLNKEKLNKLLPNLKKIIYQ